MPPKRMTTVEFIVKATALHGAGVYDYSETVYAHNAEKVTIICPVHGRFEQQAGTHLLKTRTAAGCQHCGYERMGKAKQGSTEDFIVKAAAVFGAGTYDYSQVIYKGKRAKIKIGCPKHGVFEQEPMHFLNGYGCVQCSKTQGRLHEANKARILTTAEFIGKAEAVHGAGKYSYLETAYVDSRVKVKICCPEHGVFEQLPTTHTSGAAGCPRCGEMLKIKHSREGWATYANGRVSNLYFIKLFNKNEVFYKVGLTCRSVYARHQQITRASGYACEVLAVHQSINAAAVWDWEQSILETFANLSYRPKCRFAGEGECFSSADEILAIFPL